MKLSLSSLLHPGISLFLAAALFAPFAASAGVCHFRCQGTPASAPAQEGDSNVSCSASNVATTCTAAACNDFCRGRNTPTATYACASGSSASSCNEAPARAPATTPPAGAPSSNTQTQATVARTSVFPIQLGTAIGSKKSVGGINEYIVASYNYALQIVFVMAMIMVVYGGFRYLTGSAFEDVSRGKQIIQDAVIGMMIVLGAYLLLSTVNPATLRLHVPVIGGVSQEISKVVEAGDKKSAPRTCTSDTDCPAGQRCEESQGHRACSTPIGGTAPVRCTTTADCGLAERCASNQCTRTVGTRCTSNAECGNGYVCSTARQLCEVVVRTCARDTDCPDRFNCVARECRWVGISRTTPSPGSGSASCNTNADCPPRYICARRGDLSACFPSAE